MLIVIFIFNVNMDINVGSEFLFEITDPVFIGL